MNEIVNELTEEDMKDLRNAQVQQKEGEPESQELTDGASKSKMNGKDYVKKGQQLMKEELQRVVDRNQISSKLQVTLTRSNNISSFQAI